jgi:hypothetical protein
MDAIKIGHYCKNNAWGRIANRGFYSCICPDKIKDKVSVNDLTLVCWYPTLTPKDEKNFHQILINYRICGEWFRSEAINKLLDIVTEENEASSCSKEEAVNVKVIYKVRRNIIDPGTYKFDMFDSLETSIKMNTPLRHGQPWAQSEIMKVLRSISKNTPISEIALEHQRNPSAIISRLKEVAADYHYENKMSMEDIKKFTGLSEDVIQEAINKRKFAMINKVPPKVKRIEQVQTKKEENSELMEILVTLKDIQRMMQEFIVAAR